MKQGRMHSNESGQKAASHTISEFTPSSVGNANANDHMSQQKSIISEEDSEREGQTPRLNKIKFAEGPEKSRESKELRKMHAPHQNHGNLAITVPYY